MTINGLSEMAHFPEQEVHEAVRRKDIFGVIGCIQVHIMKIVAISPPLYDIQGNVSNRVLAALTSESINIDRKQEKTLRELLQTVYRGMRSGNTRGDSIKRLLERGIPLLENIFTAEKSSAPTFQDIMPPPDTISPKDEPVV